MSQPSRFTNIVYAVILAFSYTAVVYFTRRGGRTPCTNVDTLPNITRDGDWLTVVPDTLHIYSSYLDDRESPAVVKVIGAGVHRSAFKSFGVYCEIWVTGGYRGHWIHVTPATENPLPVRMGRRYEGHILTCQLPQEWDPRVNAPSYVTLSPEPCFSPPAMALAIQSRPQPFVPKYNFTMCLTPIYGGFSKTGELLGYMEMNRILGADHFIFYNLSIGPSLTPLLDSYQKEGLLEVLDWKMPLEGSGPVPDIHYFGQLVSLNDCLYRARMHSTYAVFSDLDEVMAPLQHEGWRELIEDVIAKHRADEEREGDPSCFVFQNTFFRTSWPEDPRFGAHQLNRRYRFFSMTYTKRETYILEHLHSKVICYPDRVQTMAIHSTHSLVPGYRDVVVPKEVGLLFHYRSQVYGRLWTLLLKAWGKDQMYIVERRMFHFSSRLLVNVEARLRNVGIFDEQSQKATNSSYYMWQGLNFFLQTQPWAKSILFE